MKRSFEGSVYKSSSGKGWIARLRYTDQNGKQREKKRVCLSHALAKAKIKVLKIEIESETEFCSSKSFAQLVDFYRKHYLHSAKYVNGEKISGFRQKLHGLSYYIDVAHEHFGNRDLESITYSDLQEYKAKIVALPSKHGRQRSIASINHFLKCLRRLFNVAIEQQWLTANPFSKGAPLIRASLEESRTRILSVEEETRLINACSGYRAHLRPIVIFAIETGCRRNEILTVRWKDVNIDRRFIKIESHNTKTLKGRFVPISARLADELDRLKRNSLPDRGERVFHITDFKKAFHGACKAAEIYDIKFHDLRHTAITRMLEKNISPPLVMKISGHSQSRTFMRYVNQSENSITEIAYRLDRAA